MQPEQLVTAQGKMRLIAFVENLYRPWMTALPSEWVTSILFAQCQNNTRGIVLNFLSLAVLALLAVLMVYAVAGLFFKKAWADAVTASPVVRAKAGRDFVLNFFPSRVRGFIRKDTLSFQRDTLEKGSLLILMPLVFVYLYSMYLLNRHIQNVNEEQVFSFLYVYLFNFFYASVVIAGLSGRWVLPSVSAEGNNFKLIKKSPTPLKDFIQAKFLIGFLPLLVLAEALILSSSVILHMPFAFIALAACTMGILCFGITLICLIVGMRKADFSIVSPLDFALSMRGLVCLTWELVFVMAVLVSVGIPTALVLYRGFSVSSIAAMSISLLVILVVMVMLVRLYTSSLLKLSRRIA
jgi:ABC-2 type transport system permease protein